MLGDRMLQSVAVGTIVPARFVPSFDDDDLFRDRNLSFVGLVYKFTEVMMIMRHVIATSHTNTLT